MLRPIFALLLSWALVCPAPAQFNSFPPGAFTGKAARDPAAGGGGGGPTIVQQIGVDVTVASTTYVATFSSGIAAGSVIVVVGHFSASAFPIVSVTDDKGDTSTDSGLGQPYDNNSICAFIEAFLAPTVGAKIVTVLFSGTATGHIQIYEVAGLTGSFDKVPAFTLNITTTAIVSNASGTLTAANEFAVAYFSNYASMTGAGGGFTSDGTSAVGGTDSIWMHNIVSSTASLTASTTAAGISDGMGLLATLK